MINNRFTPSASALAILFILVFPGSLLPAWAQHKNQYAAWQPYAKLQQGLVWPCGQALPQFSPPADTLDGIDLSQGDLSAAEKTLFAALQGLVNKTRPRIFLLDASGEGKYKWPQNLHLQIRVWPAGKTGALLKKYRQEITGAVLYRTEKSPAYLNLATTIGGLKQALPLTPEAYRKLLQAGIRLPVAADLTKLPYTTPAEIYQYLHDHYRKDYTKRLLISLSPSVPARIRDIGMAAGAPCIWLDPRKPEEKKVLEEFLRDMKAGQGLILGWWPEERSGVGLGTSFGIPTVAADFYENATVYAGMPHTITLPETPRMPKLENKIYLALFLSDGDNAQYCEHALSKLWEDTSRGIIPINWTISPALADLGPGLLNYYTTTASPNDFFAAGPSGLGYALIYDALNKKWNLTDPGILNAYTKFSEPYLEKCGLRVITIWDEVNPRQMKIYADNCRYLYGVTVEDWQRHAAPLQPVSREGRLAFLPNQPCYAGNINDIYKRWAPEIAAFDSSRPLFLAAQGVSWRMGPRDIVRLKERLEKLSPGHIVICRGDHFFSLYNEAHELDFNLCLLPGMKISSGKASTPASLAADGSPSAKYQWVSSRRGSAWIRFDLGGSYTVDRYVVRHAGAAGMDPSLNTRSFTLEASADGRRWKTVDRQAGNRANVSDIDIPPVTARYLRLLITDPGKDSVARIGDIELYGKSP